MALDEHETAYKAHAENPEAWLSSAKNLLAAADKMWASVQSDFTRPVGPGSQAGATPGGEHHADIAQAQGEPPPLLQHAACYLMIAGFAVENVLKALRVAQDPQSIISPKKGTVGISRTVHSHDLQGLARHAGLALTHSEGRLLVRLEAYLRWAGRYPVAAVASGQAAVQNIWATDQADVKSVFEKVEAAYRRATP